MVDEEGRSTLPAVTGAVSVGTAPLPFLAVYAVLFLLHGGVHPVHPPDITGSQRGELIAGVIVAVIFVIATTTLVWFLNRRRRWPYAIVQLAVLGACIDFLIDPTKGGRAVSGLLVITTVVSLFFGFAPDSWAHLGRTCPAWLAGLYARVGLGGEAAVTTRPSREPAPAGTATPPTSVPSTMVEPAGLRRRRFGARSPGGPDTGP